MKIAVITGASSGMGREFARQIPKLYRQLDEIWVVSRRTDRLKELEKESTVPVRIFDGDLKRDYIYERIEKELDRKSAKIRMLVNAAGYGKMGAFDAIPLSEQLGMVDLNLKALTKMTGICLPFMDRGSRIVNVSSAAAFCPQPGFAVYAAGKSYVYRFSLALREELKRKGILVTAVCPGPVETEFFRISGELPGNLKKTVRADAASVVRQALKDAARGKSVSVYGTSMKAARVLCKLLPDVLLAAVMARVNHISESDGKQHASS